MSAEPMLGLITDLILAISVLALALWILLTADRLRAVIAFLANGLLIALGHDRIDELGGLGRLLPITLVAFALSGMSLMGLPPSGGFAAKWLLLRAAIETGQWWWTLVILFGGVLTGAYLYRVLAAASFAGSGAGVGAGPPSDRQSAALPEPAEQTSQIQSVQRQPRLQRPVARSRELIVLALALISIALGLVPLTSFEILQIGRGGEAMAMLEPLAEPVGLSEVELPPSGVTPVPSVAGPLKGAMAPLPVGAGSLPSAMAPLPSAIAAQSSAMGLLPSASGALP